MITIENELLKVAIAPKGAELQSVFHKGHRLEYLWEGDPAFWGKHSPILFPIVGTLKKDSYIYRDKQYAMSRHGFARDSIFETVTQKPDGVDFLLKSNADTRANYPFDFNLRIGYRLLPEGLSVHYRIDNPSTHGDDLYFSIGAHPAFKVPLQPGTAYEDYYLEFEKQETAPRWPISKEGLIGKEPQPLLDHTHRLPLSRALFAADALVLKHAASSAIILRSPKTPHGLRVEFPGFPFLGLWAAKNADFVCIEPWCGIADSEDSDQQFTRKEGINRLEPGASFEREWILTLF